MNIKNFYENHKNKIFIFLKIAIKIITILLVIKLVRYLGFKPFIGFIIGVILGSLIMTYYFSKKGSSKIDGINRYIVDRMISGGDKDEHKKRNKKKN